MTGRVGLVRVGQAVDLAGRGEQVVGEFPRLRRRQRTRRARDLDYDFAALAVAIAELPAADVERHRGHPVLGSLPRTRPQLAVAGLPAVALRRVRRWRDVPEHRGVAGGLGRPYTCGEQHRGRGVAAAFPAVQFGDLLGTEL